MATKGGHVNQRTFVFGGDRLTPSEKRVEQSEHVE
jgi:hypothetical protein